MKTIALDLETRGRNNFNEIVWSLTISYNGRKAFVYHNCNGLKRKDIPKQVIKDLEDESFMKIAHQVLFDGSFLASQFGIWIKNLWCTMNSETVLQGVALPMTKKKSRTPYEQKLFAAHGVALEDVLPRYRMAKPDKSIREGFIDRPLGIPFTRAELKYMEADVLPLIKLQQNQEYILTRDHLLKVVLLENKYTEKRIAAKVHGIGFDSDIWRDIAIKTGREFDKRIAALPPDVENWNSEKQVKAFFRRIGIVITTYKSSSPSVDDLDSLYLKTKNKILGTFIMARELHKSVTSYGLNWFNEKYIDSDGRIRPDVIQIKETGRTSMANPNLQQLPGFGRKDYEHELVMDELYGIFYGKNAIRIKAQHRRAFVPRPGYCFVINDFSGQEIGVMASASGEKLWIDTMLRGDDVHGMTASLLYAADWIKGAGKGCSFPKKCHCPNHITPRERAKILNFMLAYGGGPQRFCKATGLSMMESRVTVARYKRIIAALTKYLDRNARQAVNTGESYSADPYRRRRVLRGAEKWQIENQGKNNPIQSAGADMLKLAAISIPDKYYSPLEIHDEIILEVKLSEAVMAAKVLKKVMEQAADYITGIKGLIKTEPKVQMNLMKSLKPTPKLTGIKKGEFCYIPKIK